MKHQYFGDIIDLFKYDLLKTLSEDIRFNEILFVPMLTENDSSNDGKKRNYQKAKAGNKDQELIKFLKENSEHKHERNAKIIEKYFKHKNINFRFEPEEIFTNKNRKAYFSDLVSSLQTSSVKNQLLFFDPDNGMEVKNNNHKHILYSELKNSLNSICKNSVICVIQFRHRKNWKETLQKKKRDLVKEVSPFTTYIADNNIAFYLIAKSGKRLNEVEKSLRKYREVYPLLIFNGYIWKNLRS